MFLLHIVFLLVGTGALGPLRCVQDIRTISADAVRPVIAQDFHDALNQVRARYLISQSLAPLSRATLLATGHCVVSVSPAALLFDAPAVFQTRTSRSTLRGTSSLGRSRRVCDLAAAP